MRKNLPITILLILIGVFLLSGCASISSKSMVGERLNDEMSEKLDGIWECEGGGIEYAKYLKNGELRLAGVEWEDTGFKFDETTFNLTKCGERTFINIPDTKISENNDSKFRFYCFSFSADNTLIVWAPHVDVFAKAIDSGEIQGEVKIKTKKVRPSSETTVDSSEKTTVSKSISAVYIDESSDALCKFINEKGLSVLFDVENPIIYRRIEKLN